MTVNADEPKEKKTISVVYTDWGTYQYFASFLVSFGYRGARTSDPAIAVAKIWFDGIQVYDAAETRAVPGLSWYFRPGTETQDVVPGAELAYRGQILLWFSDINLGESGSIPTVSVELVDGQELTLGSILRLTSSRAGYLPDKIEVDAGLDEIVVLGYLLDGQSTLSSVSTDLEFLYGFSMVEVSGTVHFRYSYDEDGDILPDTTIDEQNIAVLREGVSAGLQIDPIAVSGDQSLPRSITASYFDIDQNFDQGSQTATRNKNTSQSQSDVSASIPVVAHGAEIRSLLYDALYRSWESRNGHSLRLPTEYMVLDPGDTIAFTVYGTGYYGSIVKATLNADNSVSISLTEKLAVYSPNDVGTQPPATPLPIVGYYATNVAIFDVPDTAEDQEAAGRLNVRIAMGGFAPDAWYGARLDFAVDPGQWFPVLNLPVGQEVGIAALTVTPDEDATTLTLLLQNFDADRFDTATEEELDAGANLIYVGSGGTCEILQFGDYEIAGDTVILSALRRGLYGTDDFINSHVAGDPMAFAEDCYTVAYPVEDYQNFVQYYTRAVSAFQPLDTVVTGLYRPSGNSRKPYSPNNIMARRESNGDITISWDEDTRFSGNNDGGFSIDIFNADWSLLLRRFQGIAASPFAYWIEEQTFDGVNLGTSLNALVYELNSSHVGRGFPGGGNLPLSLAGLLAGRIGPVVGPSADLFVYKGEAGRIGPVLGPSAYLTGGVGLALLRGVIGPVRGPRGTLKVSNLRGTIGRVVGPSADLTTEAPYPIFRGRVANGRFSGSSWPADIDLDTLGFVAGDLMILHTRQMGTAGLTLHDYSNQDWTKIDDAILTAKYGTALWFKVWEANDTLQVRAEYPTLDTSYELHRIANADIVEPVDVQSINSTGSGTSTTLSGLTVTTTADNELLGSFIGGNTRTTAYTVPSGMAGPGSVDGEASAFEIRATAGATGGKLWSISPADRATVFNIAIRHLGAIYLDGEIGPVVGMTGSLSGTAIPMIDADRSFAGNNGFADVHGFDIDLPGEVNENDLIVVRVKMTDPFGGDIIVPSGWTALTTTQHLDDVPSTTTGKTIIFYRVMDGTEGGTAIGTGSAELGSIEYSVAVITGADPSDPIDDWDQAAGTTIASVDLEVTTTEDKALLLAWTNVFVGGKTFVDPTGFIAVPKWETDLGYIGGYQGSQETAGASGTVSLGVTPTTAINMDGWLVAIKPA